jgi:hypothetical protein
MTFKLGESGNPNGRPKGTGFRQQAFNALIEPYREDLFRVALDMALGGNEAMLRLFLERMLPAKPTQEPISVNFDQEERNNTGSLLSFGKNVISCVAGGNITPKDGQVLSTLLETQRKLIEQGDIKEQLDKIEEKLNLKGFK